MFGVVSTVASPFLPVLCGLGRSPTVDPEPIVCGDFSEPGLLRRCGDDPSSLRSSWCLRVRASLCRCTMAQPLDQPLVVISLNKLPP